jgi:hypothetical protein
MSKLRAEITYSHHLHKSPISIEHDIENTNEITNVNQDSSNLHGLENNGDNEPE